MRSVTVFAGSSPLSGGVFSATKDSVTGSCAVGDCSACFFCFGMGIILVALALFRWMGRDETDGLAHNGK